MTVQGNDGESVSRNRILTSTCDSRRVSLVNRRSMLLNRQPLFRFAKAAIAADRQCGRVEGSNIAQHQATPDGDLHHKWWKYWSSC